MSYELAFLAPALKEWPKLDAVTRDQFKARLAERLIEPKLVSARLSGKRERYKIKLRSAGYPLIYEVRDELILVVVVAVGRRDRNAIYKVADRRGSETLKRD